MFVFLGSPRKQVLLWQSAIKQLTSGQHQVITTPFKSGPPPFVVTDLHTTVGKCFACELARQWPQHYLDTPRAYVLPPNTKAWKCRGKDFAPEACPSNQFTHSDDWSECICDGATYLDPQNSSACLTCPAGHYCVKGKKIQCPNHYYQSESGQSACIQCASRTDFTGEFSLCVGNKQLRVCDSKNIETQNQPLLQNCVECSKCKKLYSTIESGQVDCYRSYKAGAA